MDWKFTGDKPVYQQIMEQLRIAVLAREFAPGDRIPSVRELAAQARVNPNTMQRALLELEQERLLINHGTAGRCVTEDQAILDLLHKQAVEQAVQSCACQFHVLGLNMRQAAQLLLEAEEGSGN